MFQPLRALKVLISQCPETLKQQARVRLSRERQEGLGDKGDSLKVSGEVQGLWFKVLLWGLRV